MRDEQGSEKSMVESMVEVTIVHILLCSPGTTGTALKAEDCSQEDPCLNYSVSFAVCLTNKRIH